MRLSDVRCHERDGVLLKSYAERRPNRVSLSDTFHSAHEDRR